MFIRIRSVFTYRSMGNIDDKSALYDKDGAFPKVIVRSHAASLFVSVFIFSAFGGYIERYQGCKAEVSFAALLLA